MVVILNTITSACNQCTISNPLPSFKHMHKIKTLKNSMKNSSLCIYKYSIFCVHTNTAYYILNACYCPPSSTLLFIDSDKGLSDCKCGRSGVFPSEWSHLLSGKCQQCWLLHTPACTDYSEECPGHQEPSWGSVRPWEYFSQYAGE